MDRLLKSLCNTPWIIVKEASNGNILHSILKIPPIVSLGKYIPLVKHTNCTIILPNPPVAFSLTKLPIKIPIEIKNIEIIIDTRMVGIIVMVNDNPSNIAVKKNKMF